MEYCSLSTHSISNSIISMNTLPLLVTTNLDQCYANLFNVEFNFLEYL